MIHVVILIYLRRAQASCCMFDVTYGVHPAVYELSKRSKGSRRGDMTHPSPCTGGGIWGRAMLIVPPRKFLMF